MINKRERPENEGLATDEIANGSKIADDSMILESLSDVESPIKDESAVEDSSACEGKKRKSKLVRWIEYWLQNQLITVLPLPSIPEGRRLLGSDTQGGEISLAPSVFVEWFTCCVSVL